MNKIDTQIAIEQIESNIRRMTAMRESCKRFNSIEGIEACDTRIAELAKERHELTLTLQTGYENRLDEWKAMYHIH